MRCVFLAALFAGTVHCFAPTSPRAFLKHNGLSSGSPSSSSSSALRMADFSLDPSSTAFVFIEYQNEFTTPGGKLHDAVKDCMEKTNSKLC